MNLAIQILASYPPSGKEKGYEAQPSGGVSGKGKRGDFPRASD